MVEEQAARNNNPAKNIRPIRYPTRQRPRAGRSYSFRGRIHCGLCGRRMEGAHKHGSNWYRCRFVTLRGQAAAATTGHPRAFGIREELVREATLDFLGRRLFAPERLELLRLDLARETSQADGDQARELLALNQERVQLDQALYRQSLRLEEHDDPSHPVVALATRRIEELSARREALTTRIAELQKTEAPPAPRREDIEAALDALPDLRPLAAQASPDELRELLDAFDVTVTYKQEPRALRLDAMLSPNFLRYAKKEPTTVGDIFHSGGALCTTSCDRVQDRADSPVQPILFSEVMLQQKPLETVITWEVQEETALLH